MLAAVNYSFTSAFRGLDGGCVLAGPSNGHILAPPHKNKNEPQGRFLIAVVWKYETTIKFLHYFATSVTHVVRPFLSRLFGSSEAVFLPLTLRLLMPYIYIYIYIYMEHLFLMFLDHTQRRSTVGRTPLDE